MKKSVMLLLLICSQLSAMEEGIKMKELAAVEEGTKKRTQEQWRSYIKLMNTQLYELRNKRRKIKKEKPVLLTPYSSPYSSPYVTDSEDEDHQIK